MWPFKQKVKQESKRRQYHEKFIKHLTKCLRYGKIYAEEHDKVEYWIPSINTFGIFSNIYINKYQCFVDDNSESFVFDISKETFKAFRNECKICAEKINESKGNYMDKIRDEWVDNDRICHTRPPHHSPPEWWYAEQNILIPKE